VNLYSDEAEEILDSVTIALDSDDDKISDDLDLCDNSLKENNIMPYGCKKMLRDSDADGVIDSKDSCAMTPANAKVSADGCALDDDMDGVKDYADKCLKTPMGYNVDGDGCSVSLSLRVKFKFNSSDVPSSSKSELDELAEFLKQNTMFKALIVGHTNNIGEELYNLKLSDSRAKAIKEALYLRGVEADRLSSEGRGESEPMADNDTPEGLHLNRRVEIELSKESEEL